MRCIPIHKMRLCELLGDLNFGRLVGFLATFESNLFSEANLCCYCVVSPITGNTLALAHVKINRKVKISIPCKIVTPENFSLKLCPHDYIANKSSHKFLCTLVQSGLLPKYMEYNTSSPQM